MATALCTKTEVKTSTNNQIFVLLLNSGKFVIGESSKPAKRIAAINSGFNAKVGSRPLQVNAIIDIKPCDEGRSLRSVVDIFTAQYGKSRIIPV